MLSRKDMVLCRLLVLFLNIFEISQKLKQVSNLSLEFSFHQSIQVEIKLPSFQHQDYDNNVIKINKIKLIHFFTSSKKDLQFVFNDRAILNIKSSSTIIATATIDLKELTSPIVNKKVYNILCLGNSDSGYSCYIKVK